MNRYKRWLNAYIGKRIIKDLNAVSEDDSDFDWRPVWDEEKDIPSCAGTGYIESNLRDYMPSASDERAYWSIVTGIDFDVDFNGRIAEIRMTARVLGDDGLGDCWPEDEWKMEDYRKAKTYLEMITKK